MTKRKTKRAAGAEPRVTLADLPQALDELEINVPYYDARLVGGRIELHLYGGQVATWPPPSPVSPSPVSPPPKPDPGAEEKED